ncbi:AAA ATPase-like protein [Azospirillum brasilense]|uniref:AAA ATPase-like protein n=1 Tax=Azospirillum brasilense TaxID=192 RepID=A0A560BM82_AZOBR|nr:AAA family ATPase [Azospirillum brasilense]TWA73733.1 AAA ATPase-like protein [Azospirillum brasilense]
MASIKGGLRMFLASISVKNYRSIDDSGEVKVERLQAFVGENNAGKSNILRAIACFLSVGAGGVKLEDVRDPKLPIEIEASFAGLTDRERKELRRYLVGDRLTVKKELTLVRDDKADKWKLEVSYRGYMAEPKNWWLSIDKIIEMKGSKPKWEEIAHEVGIFDIAKNSNGKIDKKSYEAAISYIVTHNKDIEFDEPVLSDGKAMGIQQNLLRFLPEFFLLPAITDYADEIDRRSSSTVFRRLMAELSERMLTSDPRYGEIDEAVRKLNDLFNAAEDGGRLAVLQTVETALTENIADLMPSVSSVRLSVEMEQSRELFSRGVSLRVHDGVLTDVLDKGHGLQRSVVFGLLKMLISKSRSGEDGGNSDRPILLGIEEPELYIHPQSQRLIWRVLCGFSKNHQVVYTTHSPAMIDIGCYEGVAIVRKPTASVGTQIHQCDAGVLGSQEEKQGFKLLNSFKLQHNSMFFAREVILVEGEQDEIAIVATGRKLGLFEEFPEEIGWTVVSCDNKEQIPKFQKLLNAYGIPYSVWVELDGLPEDHKKNKTIIDLADGNTLAKMPKRMEDAAGLDAHFSDTFHCRTHFCDPGRITPQLEALVKTLFRTDILLEAAPIEPEGQAI